MREDSESKTVINNTVLIGLAYINGYIAFLLEGKSSYNKRLRNALFQLNIGIFGNAVDVFSIVVAFSVSRLFLFGPIC